MKLKKMSFFSLVFVCISIATNAQQTKNIGIGTVNPDPSSILHLNSSNQGFLMTRFSNGTIANIDTPIANGLMIYNTDETEFQYMADSVWSPVSQWRKSGNTIYNSNSGNVGIGVTNPVTKLHVDGGNVRVSNSFGIIFTPDDNGSWGWISNIGSRNNLEFGIGGTVGNNTKMVIKYGGNVGIGTSSFGNGEKLAVSGNGVQLGIFPGYRDNTSDANWTTIDMPGNKNLRVWDNFSVSGRVGVGTVSPQYPLDVKGYKQVTAYYGSIYTSGSNCTLYSTGFIFNGGGTCSASGAQFISAEFEGDVLMQSLLLRSDERIKKSIVRSQSQKDLERLDLLSVTDYNYIDEVGRGNKRQKGFIAQEVEKIYPEAVTKKTGFIPNIYAMAKSIVEENGTLKITMQEAHNLNKDDIVRLIGNSTAEEPVTSVLDEYSFKVKSWGDDANMLFVFGKQVDDFLTVDYDRIYTLGISAIQELHNISKEQQEQIVALQQKNNSISSENEMLKVRLEKIEGYLGMDLSTCK